MRSPSPILFVVATATLMLGRPMALPAADLDSDATARTIRRPDPVTPLANDSSVLGIEDVRWLDVPMFDELGVVGDVLTVDPLDEFDTRRSIVGAAHRAGNFGRPNDFFGLLGALDQSQDSSDNLLLPGKPDSFTVMGFYSAQITPQIRVQSSLGLTDEMDGTKADLSGLLGLKIHF